MRVINLERELEENERCQQIARLAKERADQQIGIITPRHPKPIQVLVVPLSELPGERRVVPSVAPADPPRQLIHQEPDSDVQQILEEQFEEEKHQAVEK